jgi:hypothetical protein
MKVTEVESLGIQSVLLDLLQEYNRTFQDPDQDIGKMVTESSKKIANIVEGE